MVLKDIGAKSLTTGIAAIDQVLGGGIALGSLMLLEGPPETGKSVLSQYFVHHTLVSRLGVAYYTSEGSIKGIMSQMSSLDLDVTDYFLSDRLRVYALTTEGKTNSDVSFATLLDHIERLPDSIKLIIIDSLTGLIARSDEEAVADFFSGCQQICGAGRTILAAVRTEDLEDSKRDRLRVICNAHLVFTNEQKGEKAIKVLEVAKIRNAAPESANTIGFDMEPGLGISTTPFTRAGE
ncbi:MAG: ATPase domain-containing protein [Dehalococcoidia bacterium]